MLFNWLLDVASPEAMNLNDSSLLLAFRLVDRYVDAQPEGFAKNHLHILGIAALFLAVKMHGVDIPFAEDFLYFLDDNHYMENHLLTMEKKILQAVHFVFYHAVDECCRQQHLFHNPFPDETESAALFSYLWDLALVDHRMNSFSVCEVRHAAETICCYTASTAQPPRHRDSRAALENFVDAIQDEKLRIESGKRTAIQRKHTRGGMVTIHHTLFENLSKVKHALLRRHQEERRGVLTRSATLRLLQEEASPQKESRKRKRTHHRQQQQEKKRCNDIATVVRCMETTKQGKRCKLPALDGKKFCSKHHYVKV